MFEDMEKYAHDKKVPIMLKDGIEFLCDYIKENKIIRILEIGSAIGYSAIKMANVSPNIKVITIEKDLERYEEAIKNINKYHFNDQIDVIYGDALDIEIAGKFDLIFIDASKSHNITFFEKFKHNLDIGGVIITDNLKFHGLVMNDELIKTKNQRSLVNKIRKYIAFLKENKEFKTEFIDVGDGVSISKRV